MELGIYTFADLDLLHPEGKAKSTHQRFIDLMEEIKLADELGFDVFGVGEHHRVDYAISSPTTVLAAAAMITKKIKLTSAVTVLSSDDPIRVFQQFATVDQLSSGRAEIMVGRGSFIESFPLFGYDLNDYDELFEEKLNMLLELNKSEVFTWEGIVHRDIKPENILLDKKGSICCTSRKVRFAISPRDHRRHAEAICSFYSALSQQLEQISRRG